MILLQLLDHDLHHSRQKDQVLLWIETPAKPGFVPAVVSGSTGRFLVCRKLTKDKKLRSGVFTYDSDRLDDLLGDLVTAAYNLSLTENWPNVFHGKDRFPSAFDFIRKSFGMSTQPHVALIPAGQSRASFSKLAGKDLVDDLYRKVCRVIPCKVPFPVLFSRPDFVGMYTQFLGGRSSIALHNIKNGLAFCPPEKSSGN